MQTENINLIVLDFGNTRMKAGVFANGELRNEIAVDRQDAESAIKELFSSSEVQDVAAVTVERNVEEMLQRLCEEEEMNKPFVINHNTPMPFGNSYETPETLGMDRIVNVAGAMEMTDEYPVLVIDAGTAITYDYLDADGVYQGGGISPGISLRFRALNEFTARLPKVEADGLPNLVGKTTDESIKSGVVNGVLGELQEVVNKYRKLSGGKLQVYMTGGDADFLGNHLENINFVSSNLLLRGIQAVFAFNKNL